jgi:flagellar biosynthesis/type III secretory pathway chaperone
VNQAADPVRARLLDAVERADVASRLAEELAAARTDLARSTAAIERLRELIEAEQAGVDRLERLGWTRLVSFAQGTVDEDLRVRRAEAAALRDRLRAALGRLEDAQVRAGDLAHQQAEFAGAEDELERALAAAELEVFARGDWRVRQLSGLRRRQESVAAESARLQAVRAQATEATATVRELVAVVETAIPIADVQLNSPAIHAVERYRAAGTTQLAALWDAVDQLPCRLGDLPPAPPLRHTNLFRPAVLSGLEPRRDELVALHGAAVGQRHRLAVLTGRVEAEIAVRTGQLRDVAGLRQRLLVMPDRA